jgi:signal transduction histidine kinase
MNTTDAAPSWLRRGLNLAGVFVVGFYFSREFAPHLPFWMTLLSYLALAAWFGNVLIPESASGAVGVLLLVMVVSGSLVTFRTDGLMIVPVAIAIVRAIRTLGRPLWHGMTLALVAAGLVPVGGLIVAGNVAGNVADNVADNVTPLSLFAVEAGIAVAVLAGISRRQYRAATQQARLLLEERVGKQEEQARATALAERQTVARDIHDVLAHSLGGLVIQLDAVDALLEAGKTEDATARVRDARDLAASGLSDARRAVDALRDPRTSSGSVTGDELAESLVDLVRSHRALGGSIRFESSGDPRNTTPDEAHALRRAMQEALTNARKHAPGQPVSATLRWADDAVELEVSNPIGAPDAAAGERSATGGGHGLTGMAERFATIPGGRVSAERAEGSFVVSARVGQA